MKRGPGDNSGTLFEEDLDILYRPEEEQEKDGEEEQQKEEEG